MQALNAWVASKWASLTDETGASMVEYALLVVLIAIVAIAAVNLAGDEVSSTFSDVADNLSNP